MDVINIYHSYIFINKSFTNILLTDEMKRNVIDWYTTHKTSFG